MKKVLKYKKIMVAALVLLVPLVVGYLANFTPTQLLFLNGSSWTFDSSKNVLHPNVRVALTNGLVLDDYLSVGTDGENGFDHYVDSLFRGAIVAFGTNSVPSGWLLCNGAYVDKTTYANLYAVIGDTWSVPYGGVPYPDSLTKFQLPDLRGYFLIGVQTGVVTLGSILSDYAASPIAGLTGLTTSSDFTEHYHTYNDTYFMEKSSSFSGATTDVDNDGDNNSRGISGSDNRDNDDDFGLHYTRLTSAAGAHTHSVTFSGVTSDAETRPINNSVNFYIKY